MTPGASTGRARKSASASAQRSRARRAAAHGRKRSKNTRRKLVVVGAVALVGLAAGYGIANRDQLEDTIRSVTLPLRHEEIIVTESEQHDVPPDLIAAMIYTESKFRDQTSPAGARGLMQITPPTAELIEKESGGTNFSLEDLSDPEVNIAYGTFYIRLLLDKFGGNEIAALAAYNGGETNVAEWGGADLETDDIRFQETRDYVDRVQEKREEYREHYGAELGLD
jgi:soluble lytic murein transglycosylase